MLDGQDAAPAQATDDEEQRHHLREPREQLGGGQQRQHVLSGQGAVLDPDRHDQPVADHDDQDGGTAHEVDGAVPVLRCGVRQVPQLPATAPSLTRSSRPPPAVDVSAADR